MSDDLSRWARERAPDLVRRAEAEAVAVLRDALLEAAHGARPERRAAPEPPAPVEGDALWVYCVTGPDAAAPEGLPSVGGGPVERIRHGELAALVSRVPLSEFGEEPLRHNLNDLAWLERVARAHEDVLEGAMDVATIVPLRLCTIYADEAGVQRMLAAEEAALTQALDLLDGHEEWGVKLLVDRATLEEAARAEVEPADEGLGSGGAYLVQRRRERETREAADRLAAELAEDVHARLQDWARGAVLNPPQNPELSGHEGQMLLNGAYLVEAGRVGELRRLLDELERRHSALGARLELTGPWPPYNFVPRAEEAV